MVDGKEVAITPQELDEFFRDIPAPPKGRIYTEREKAIIIEGFKRGVNKDDLARKLHTSPHTMKRFYQAYLKEQGL